MPCYKCSNGKYKYGERGRCQFDTLSACEAAERAIHARENKKENTKIVMKSPYFEYELCDECKDKLE